jgi:hypothetical protein
VFRKNVGGVDRAARLAMGTVLLSSGAIPLDGWEGGILGPVLAAFGFLGLTTGATGFCPLYVPLDLSTRRRGDAPSSA